ncbi:MAG: alpha/beta hydrolase, partial [Gemmatimonadota bacterium]|nr:alpha/beta hydrolase [Gemmatimonadota bacterium]
MKTHTLIFEHVTTLAAIAIGLTFAPKDVIAQLAGKPAATVGRYASVNGLRMYYELHGQGRPLVLLHGAFSNINTDFAKILPRFARTRRVIAVELQAHGRTADVDRPLTYEQMA